MVNSSSNSDDESRIDAIKSPNKDPEPMRGNIITTKKIRVYVYHLVASERVKKVLSEGSLYYRQRQYKDEHC